jgi:aldehyde:ferredoxin oxidoreductase
MQISIFTALGLLFRENCRSMATMSDAGKIGFDTFSHSTKFVSRGCYRCPIKCEKKYKVKEGKFAGEEGAKYELGYGCTLGFNLGIDNLSAVLHLTNRCNDLGMDVIDFSSSVATAIDLYRNSIISRSDTDGLELSWNDPATAETLATKTAMREGFGDLLAGGVRTIGEKVGKGAEKYALHIKGMSEPAHSCPPFLLGFSVATRGGDHLKGMPILILESSNKDMTRLFFQGTNKSQDLYSHEDKGRVVWWHENYKTIIDSLGICFFLTTVLLASGRLEPAELATAWRLATGLDGDGAGIFTMGEMAYQVERAFNALQGVTRADDTFKVREEKDSWGKGVNLDHPGMLDEYYRYRGCSRNGLPLRERLEEIGLPDVADTLESAGKLGETGGSYLPVSPLIDPMAREFTVTPGKGDEVVSHLMKDEKVMKLISSPGLLNLVGWGINAKKKAGDFFRSKYGVPTILSAGALGIYAHYLSRKKEKQD